MEKYYLVTWPESQEIMEEDWFNEEAIFACGDNVEGSSYFVPCETYDKHINQKLIEQDGI